tara:strand:+ start:266 stop:472 length:207 start_codon:yes stop_codon:yes gene_type:complete
MNFQHQMKSLESKKGRIYGDRKSSLSQSRNQVILTLYPLSDEELAAGLTIKSDIPVSFQTSSQDAWDN